MSVNQLLMIYILWFSFFFSPLSSKIQFKQQGVWHCNINVDIDENCWLLLHFDSFTDIDNLDSFDYKLRCFLIGNSNICFTNILQLLVFPLGCNRCLAYISIINDAKFTCFKLWPISIVVVSICSIQQQLDIVLNTIASMWHKGIGHC